MTNAAQSLSILLLIIAVALAGFATVALRYRSEPGARGFALAGFAMACWTVVVSINIYPMHILPLHISMTLRNGFVLLMSLGWLLFVLEYLRRDRIALKPLPVALVLVIPVLTVLLTATNPYHHLAIGADTPAAVGGGPEIDWGPWHLVFMAFGFTINVIPAGMLARDLREAHGAHRRQVQLLLAGWVIAFVGANDYLITGALDGVPAYVRLSPFAYLLAVVLFSIALFRHQLFGLVPVSRRTVVETMPDPVVAVDDDGTVVDMNPAALALFGPVAKAQRSGSDDGGWPARTGGPTGQTGTPAVTDGTDPSQCLTGRPLSDICTDHPALLEHDEAKQDDTEVSIETPAGERHFSVTSEPIRDGTGGSVILLRDVTELKDREERLERKNEQLDQFATFITHDLRNPLAVATLSLETAQSLDDESIDRVENALERMDEMVSDVRALTRIDRESVTLSTVDLAVAGRRAWDQIQTEDGTLVVADDGTIRADQQYLRHIFENLFRNSIEHGGTEITVTVGMLPDGFYVEDDGPGIAPEERENVLEYGVGSASDGGYGLTIVHNVATVHDWTVTVTAGEDGGARFEFTGVELVDFGTSSPASNS